MKRSGMIAAIALSITMLAASVTSVSAEEKEPIGLNISASPAGTDITIDVWDLSLHLPSGIKYKLDSEYDNFYIYAMEDGSIPYVMVRSYEYTSDAADFMDEFIDYLKESYPDLEVIEDAQYYDTEKYMFIRTQVGYTISGGYKAVDTRLAIQNNDDIVLVSVKEVPDEDLVVGDLLEQVLSGIDLKGAQEKNADAAPADETDPSDTETDPSDTETVPSDTENKSFLTQSYLKNSYTAKSSLNESAEVIQFGSYEQDNDPDNGKEPIEWIVLDKKDGKTLIISKHCLSAAAYHEKKTEEVTWETCSLRKCLNEEFLNEAFEAGEQEQIITSHVMNEENLEWETEAGNETEDKVFLLSLDEAEQYFEDNESRLAAFTAYALAQAGFETNGNTDEGLGNSWWLRSPGMTNRRAATVAYDGEIDFGGFWTVSDVLGIRPALWVNLE